MNTSSSSIKRLRRAITQATRDKDKSRVRRLNQLLAKALRK